MGNRYTKLTRVSASVCTHHASSARRRAVDTNSPRPSNQLDPLVAHAIRQLASALSAKTCPMQHIRPPPRRRSAAALRLVPHVHHACPPCNRHHMTVSEAIRAPGSCSHTRLQSVLGAISAACMHAWPLRRYICIGACMAPLPACARARKPGWAQKRRARITDPRKRLSRVISSLPPGASDAFMHSMPSWRKHRLSTRTRHTQLAPSSRAHAPLSPPCNLH